MIFVILVGAGILGLALIFEHVWGYVPCAMCLLQREPYYLGVPVAVLALAGLLLRWPDCFWRGLMAIVGILFLYNMALGIQHSGLEWGWWEAPSECTAPASSGRTVSADNLLGSLSNSKPPSCDKPAWRMLGLSFAGWNVLISLALAMISFRIAAFGRKST